MHFLQSLIPALEHFRLLGYWLVLLVAFVESLAFVGLFIPGTVFVIFLGFLSSQGYFDPGYIIWFATIGSVLGDLASFKLGRGGKKFFHSDNKIFKLSFLERGERFFGRYGNKSVFFGRFLGPLRPVIPFVAGLVKMNFKKFLFWNTLSGFAWAAVYVFIGYFFGTAWRFTELWTPRVGVLLVSILFFLVTVSLTIRFSLKQGRQLQVFFKLLWVEIGKGFSESKVGIFLQNKYPDIYFWLQRRLTLETFFGFGFTLLSLISVYLAFLFVKLSSEVVFYHGQIGGDMRFHHLLVAFYQTTIAKFFLWVTIFGDAPVVIVLVLAIGIVFWIWRKSGYILPLFLSLFVSSIACQAVKILISRPRPELFLLREQTMSFPSGHATAAMALYGTLIIIAIFEIKNWENKIHAIWIGFLMIIAIGFSRLYLGVHYLSDVLGGFILGFFGVTLAYILLENKSFFSRFQGEVHTVRAPKNLSVKYVLTGFCFLVVAVVYTLRVDHQLYYFGLSQVKENIVTISGVEEIMPIFANKEIPLNTETLFGKVRAPVNIIFIAQDDLALANALVKSGWAQSDQVGVFMLLRKLGFYLKHVYYRSVPVAFWNTYVQDFGFVPDSTNGSKQVQNIRVWRTQFRLSDSRHVYVATITSDFSKNFGIRHVFDPRIDEDRNLLLSTLVKFQALQSAKLEKNPSKVNYSGDDFMPVISDGEIGIIELR